MPGLLSGVPTITNPLARGPDHSYGIELGVKQLACETQQVEEGSVNPAFHRMKQASWINPEWKPTDNNRHTKYYHLTRRARIVWLRSRKSGRGFSEEWRKTFDIHEVAMGLLNCLALRRLWSFNPIFA